MENFLLISAGAVLGANTRYWLGTWVSEKWGVAFPFGTLLINITGSFLLGLFMTLATERLLIDPAGVFWWSWDFWALILLFLLLLLKVLT